MSLLKRVSCLLIFVIRENEIVISVTCDPLFCLSVNRARDPLLYDPLKPITQSNDSRIVTKDSRSTTHHQHKSHWHTFYHTRQAYYNHHCDHTSLVECCLQVHELQHVHRAGEKKNVSIKNTKPTNCLMESSSSCTEKIVQINLRHSHPWSLSCVPRLDN